MTSGKLYLADDCAFFTGIVGGEAIDGLRRNVTEDHKYAKRSLAYIREPSFLRSMDSGKITLLIGEVVVTLDRVTLEACSDPHLAVILRPFH